MVRVLFLSQRGSVRSQMAKGFARQVVSDQEVALTNVGIEARAVDSRAVAVMAELDIDISQQPTPRRLSPRKKISKRCWITCPKAFWRTIPIVRSRGSIGLIFAM